MTRWRPADKQSRHSVVSFDIRLGSIGYARTISDRHASLLLLKRHTRISSSNYIIIIAVAVRRTDDMNVLCGACLIRRVLSGEPEVASLAVMVLHAGSSKCTGYDAC